MKNFSLYDVLGVLAPGSIMVVGIVALFPGVLGLVSHGEFTGGELGLVVLLSYAVGNLVTALGNLLEPPYRWLKHRVPVRTVRLDGHDLLYPGQLPRVEAKLKKLEMLEGGRTALEVGEPEWRGLGRQIYAFLATRKMTERIDLFNAQYGMNRGIAASFLALIALLLFTSGLRLWRLEAVLAVCAGLAVFRMERFWRYYGRELYTQFLVASEEAPKGTGSDAEQKKDAESDK